MSQATGSSSKSRTVKPKQGQTPSEFVETTVKSEAIVVFGKATCKYCNKVKELLASLHYDYVAVNLDQHDDQGVPIRDYLYEKTGQKTVPNVFVRGVHLGGCDNTMNAHAEGRLSKMYSLKSNISEDGDENYEYDLIVIGGGSGGLACAKRARELGAKVACLDYVKPSPIGTTWGLGGTCVNVGCIPKKLMHQSAILGERIKEAKDFGWETQGAKMNHSWSTMVEKIQNHIGSLNFKYRVQLQDKKVDYHNARGTFIDNHRILETYTNGKVTEITGKNIVVAVGGRPKYPTDIKGALENCISSDDLFSLPYNPGKTLCVGASYVSLECAGFLKGIGLDVTVMVRSILLRGFDQQMAGIIGEYMEKHGVRFIKESVPVEIVRVRASTKDKAGEVQVKYKHVDTGQISTETFNTVILAVGRDPCTKELELNKAGVKINPKNQKIKTTFEQTNVKNIYAIGDVIDESSANGRVLELTPVAIQAGQLLANRLFGKSEVKMDYYAVPTTVFTPIEYGAIGYSEEEAIEAYGQDNIEVYHQSFSPLELALVEKPYTEDTEKKINPFYAKLICNKADNERVLGLHVTGPNAGEITQGYAVAIKLRATKKDFDMTVGIHPTCSEIFTTLSITKRSGENSADAVC